MTVDEDERGVELIEAIGLWRVAPELGTAPLIRIACDALVAGLDTPGLRELAGEPYHASGLADLVEQTLAELGLPGLGGLDAELLAARARARDLLAGRLRPRDLTAWVHAAIGHDGSSAVQGLVDLDDFYFELEFIAPTEAEVDTLVEAEARRLIALAPAAWLVAPPAWPTVVA